MTTDLPLPKLDAGVPYWDYKAPRDEMYLVKRLIVDDPDRYEAFIADPYKIWTYCSPNKLVTTVDVDEHNDIGLTLVDWVKCLQGESKNLEVVKTLDVSALYEEHGEDSIEWTRRSEFAVELAEDFACNGYDFYTLNGTMP